MLMKEFHKNNNQKAQIKWKILHGIVQQKHSNENFDLITFESELETMLSAERRSPNTER